MITLTKKLGIIMFLSGIILLPFGNLNVSRAVAFTQIQNQLGVGSRGSDVTNLQMFLASDHNIYPTGLITGYYGALTASAVAQFQLAYNLPPVGRVGPLTLEKINNVISAGRGIDIYAPAITNLQNTRVGTTVTISWLTNEYAMGKVYYSTSPFQLGEAAQSFQEPIILGGQSTVLTNTASLQENITISGLLPNTTYYYIAESVDMSGNVSVTWPAIFTTGS